MPPKLVKTTRFNSDHFLVGQDQPDLGKEVQVGKLPTTRSVLKYIFFRKRLPSFKFQPIGSVLCCPFITGTLTPNCEENPGCKPGMECVVKKLKTEGNWLASGIPIVSDRLILRKL